MVFRANGTFDLKSGENQCIEELAFDFSDNTQWSFNENQTVLNLIQYNESWPIIEMSDSTMIVLISTEECKLIHGN